jgi:mannosyltransferase OCH1-like enzyme
VEGSPIHPAFYLLTSLHQSDYFRAYIINHYGGIYLDVKHIHTDLNDFFKKLYSSDKISMVSFLDLGGGACN